MLSYNYNDQSVRKLLSKYAFEEHVFPDDMDKLKEIHIDGYSGSFRCAVLDISVITIRTAQSGIVHVPMIINKCDGATFYHVIPMGMFGLCEQDNKDNHTPEDYLQMAYETLCLLSNTNKDLYRWLGTMLDNTILVMESSND